MQEETKFKLKVWPLLKAIPRSWWVKTQMVGIRGIPDWIGCVNGRFAGLESKIDEADIYKNAGHVVLQRYVLRKIRLAGGYTAIITPRTFDKVYNDLLQLSDAEKKTNQV